MRPARPSLVDASAKPSRARRQSPAITGTKPKLRAEPHIGWGPMIDRYIGCDARPRGGGRGRHDGRVPAAGRLSPDRRHGRRRPLLPPAGRVDGRHLDGALPRRELVWHGAPSTRSISCTATSAGSGTGHWWSTGRVLRHRRRDSPPRLRTLRARRRALPWRRPQPADRGATDRRCGSRRSRSRYELSRRRRSGSPGRAPERPTAPRRSRRR